MKKNILRPLFIIIFTVCLLNKTFAQNKEEDIIAGKKIKIFSKIINEERPVLISLPAGYEQSKKRYPVVYITDGSENRLLGSGGMIRYFANVKMPQMISIYIPNTDRGRDLSISSIPLDQLPNSGGKGGENFSKFFSEELIPYIDNNYRTTSYRILVGYSAGGGFVLNTLITRPDYFDAYIAASPSIFFEDEFLVKLKKFFKEIKTLDKFLYVPYYDRDVKTTTLTYPKIDKIIKESVPKGFRYKVKVHKGQDHVPATALYDGLRVLFDSWKPIEVPLIIPNNGFIEQGKDVKVIIRGKGLVRYTLDGSEPTTQSNIYTKPLIFSKKTILKAKSFDGNLSESNEVMADFKDVSGIEPEKNKNDLKSGLQYKYYDRRWYELPDTISLEPQRQGIINTFNLSQRAKNEGFIFQIDGFIKIDREGQYIFYLSSTADRKMFFGNKLVINNFSSSAKEENSFIIYLRNGYYPIRILYANAWYYGNDLKVSYEGPGIKKMEIPKENLFH